MNIKEPIYKKIEEDIRQKILNGIYKKNSIIPKEIDLAKQYGVSRPTICKAIQNLVLEGYLERKKRLGTIVCEPKINQEFTQVIESYNSEMSRKGFKPKTKVLSFSITNATKEIAKNLNININDKVHKLVRLRYVNDEPIVLVTTYIPDKILINLKKEDFINNSLYSLLNTLNYPIFKIKRVLDVILADETTSDLLEINIGDPLFYFHSIGISNNNQPIEYSISKYRGDKNSFVFELSNVVKLNTN